MGLIWYSLQPLGNGLIQKFGILRQDRSFVPADTWHFGTQITFFQTMETHSSEKFKAFTMKSAKVNR
ncbi:MULTISPECIES: hypothetical protein [unclassified Paenibacillus]|uniref:hypothetical protein n=1 Tax=unclassified Paenibacillus TaxID=185978 RepID=UPI003635247B